MEFTPANKALNGSSVLRHGLPPLPSPLTTDMAVPIAYWRDHSCAAVLFLEYRKLPDGTFTPAVTMGRYRPDRGSWRPFRHWTGTGWSYDPLKPAPDYDRDRRTITIGGGTFPDPEHLRDQWAVVHGRVTSDVARLRLVVGNERLERAVDSHFGAWIVCVDQPGAFALNALDAGGAVIASLDLSATQEHLRPGQRGREGGPA